LTEQTTQLLGALAKSRLVEIKLSSSGPLVADVDPGQIQQVLTNLLDNAIQAMPKGGTIEVSLDRGGDRPRTAAGDAAKRDSRSDFARIDVRDEGVGISPDNLRQIFDPFFTTREVGEGTGLGLSLAYGIVQDHGGWIDVESVVGQGSRFSIFLPLAADAPPRTT
jgi:signal transduction histidine kinase